MKHSKASKRWLQEHFSDVYVKKAHEQGLRSRAYFKIEELDHKEHLFKKGMNIVDLGAAPGGWSQYVARKLSGETSLFALDILPMPELPGVHFICGDFTQDEVYDELLTCLNGQKVDIVISDMAPNWSGCKHIDLPKSMYLAELAAYFAKQTKDREDAVNNDLYKDQHPSMPINNERQTRVTFGGTNKK